MPADVTAAAVVDMVDPTVQVCVLVSTSVTVYVKVLLCWCIPQNVCVNMEAPVVDQCVPVHLGTLEHCVRLHVQQAVQLVIIRLTAPVVCRFVNNGVCMCVHVCVCVCWCVCVQAHYSSGMMLVC